MESAPKRFFVKPTKQRPSSGPHFLTKVLIIDLTLFIYVYWDDNDRCHFAICCAEKIIYDSELTFHMPESSKHE